MKKILVFFLVIILFGCSKEESKNPEFYTNYFKHTTVYNNSKEAKDSHEYTLDNNGKVLTDTYTNYENSQFNMVRIFEYDDKGRLIFEKINGDINTKIIWNENIATSYNNQNQKLFEFKYSNGKMIEYTFFNYGNYSNTVKLNYNNNNVISISNEDQISFEFLNFDNSKINPFYIIRSIDVLFNSPIYYYPKYKFNVFKQHYQIIEDSSLPETLYYCNYSYDSKNRVIKSSIEGLYSIHNTFEYE